MPTRRRLTSLLAAGAAATLVLLVAAGLSAGPIVGQTATPTPRATATATPSAASTATAAPSAPSAAPALDNEAAVRMILPASIRDSERLPVHKWARADMPDAPGGYVVFIATIYPIYDGQGGSTEWLLVNYLQWDGTEWLIASPDSPGLQLSGDDVWLARNLTDITAVASPPGQSWRVFTVAYTADGLVSPTLARTETVYEIYDLSLTTQWSRVGSLRETDTSNSNFVEQRAEDIDWSFADLDGDGISELLVNVADTDTITLVGSPGPGVPAEGTTQTTNTEIWKWINGVYTLQNTQPGGGQPAAATPTPTPAGRTPTPVPPASRNTPVAPFSGTPTPSPTPSGHPAG